MRTRARRSKAHTRNKNKEAFFFLLFCLLFPALVSVGVFVALHEEGAYRELTSSTRIPTSNLRTQTTDNSTTADRRTTTGGSSSPFSTASSLTTGDPGASSKQALRGSGTSISNLLSPTHAISVPPRLTHHMPSSGRRNAVSCTSTCNDATEP